jgi:hypothetical protein
MHHPIGTLILIMLFSGAYGGLVSFLLQENLDDNQGTKKSHTPLLNSILAGILSAFLVPVFLTTIASDLLSKIVSSSNNPEDQVLFLHFSGLCLAAGVFARRFITGIGQKLFEKLQNQISTVEKQTRQNAEDIENVATEQDTSIIKQASAVDPNANKILQAFSDGKYVFRSPEGLAQASGMSIEEVNKSLRKLAKEGIVASVERMSGSRWKLLS